jgi:hypothetical protein
MGYAYATERPWLFTEDGQVCLLKARDEAFRLLKLAGAVNGMNALAHAGISDTFKMMAVLDRLVELGDIREITGPNVWGQDRVFVRAREGR